MTTSAPTAAADVVLSVRDLVVEFKQSRGRVLRAVDRVGFDLHRGETLGLVGESGCGKSTTARAVLRLVPATSGCIQLNLPPAPGGAGRSIALGELRGRALREARRHVQIVFQDPYASLNPRMTAGQIIAEPMTIFRAAAGKEIKERVARLMAEVGLDPAHILRYPHEFAGGQRQRIGIARALALNPAVLICDEPVSALDVSVRSQVLNLLVDLQAKRNLSCLFIAHDLSVVKRISRRVAVMYLGKLVEVAGADDLYRRPLHPYTRSLLSAVPIPDPTVERRRRRIVLQGEIPSPSAPRAGCPFASRCPEVMPQCRTIEPELKTVEAGRQVACLLYE